MSRRAIVISVIVLAFLIGIVITRDFGYALAGALGFGGITGIFTVLFYNTSARKSAVVYGLVPALAAPLAAFFFVNEERLSGILVLVTGACFLVILLAILRKEIAS